jgi:phosphoglycolate phosphatase
MSFFSGPTQSAQSGGLQQSFLQRPSLPAHAFVLFDIDGTLLRRAGPHHKSALVDAVRLVMRLEASLEGLDTTGMLDRDLLRLMLEGSVYDGHFTPELLNKLMRQAQDCYLADCPSDLSQNVCPGVPDLLRELSRRRVPMGLVTGNLSAIGWKKMELAGLRQWFCVGAFAEEAETRAELVAFAIGRAQEQGFISRDTKISLIGDHPNDVRAARENSIQSVATATGLVGIEALRAAGPDILVTDLTRLSVDELI